MQNLKEWTKEENQPSDLGHILGKEETHSKNPAALKKTTFTERV